MNIAVVFAGGVGMRMGASVPKQFLEISGKPVLIHTLEIFERHKDIDKIRLVVPSEHVEVVREMCARHKIFKVASISVGGASAQQSIYNGLCACRDGGDPSDAIVLLHDGVRPCVDNEVISANIQSVILYGNGVTFTPCVETLVISKDGQNISDIPYRRESFAAQAPQSFRLGDILDAHKRIRAMFGGYTDMVDQATICWKLGIPIHLVPGNRGNIKITTPEDVYTLKALLKYREDRENGRAHID